ncbi:MAG TPA: hypothetical protein VFI09_08120 [Solirubrobacterales bacterium]|nr:hypothetical protein [Solirubrobacterales bacterium]
MTGADNQQICAVLLGAAVQPDGHRIKFMDDDSGSFEVDVDQGEPSLGSQKTLGQRDGVAAAASTVDSDDHVLEHGGLFSARAPLGSAWSSGLTRRISRRWLLPLGGWTSTMAPAS